MTLQKSNPTAVSVIRWFSTCCMLMLASACSTTEQTHVKIDETVNKEYSFIYLDVDLENSEDTDALTGAMVKQLDRRGLQTNLSSMVSASNQYQTDTALLKIVEIERRIVTVRYLRTYPRQSLTQMRGIKYSDKPVITLHARLIDPASGRAFYQGSYVTEGPWYAKSQSVVAAFASKLVQELEHQGYITEKRLKGTE